MIISNKVQINNSINCISNSSSKKMMKINLKTMLGNDMKRYSKDMMINNNNIVIYSN